MASTFWRRLFKFQLKRFVLRFWFTVSCVSLCPKPLSVFQAPRLKHTKTHARAKDCSMEYRQVPIPYSCHKHQRWHLSKMVRWLVSQRSAMGPGAGQVFVSWLRGFGMGRANHPTEVRWTSPWPVCATSLATWGQVYHVRTCGYNKRSGLFALSSSAASRPGNSKFAQTIDEMMEDQTGYEWKTDEEGALSSSWPMLAQRVPKAGGRPSAVSGQVAVDWTRHLAVTHDAAGLLICWDLQTGNQLYLLHG